MRIRKAWAIVAALLLCLSVAAWIFTAQASSVSDILRPAQAHTGLQNFSLGYDDKQGILLVGTYKNVLIAYDKNAKELWRFDGKGPFRDTKVDSNARKVYAACEDGNVYVLNLDTGEKLMAIDAERRVYSVDVTADGSVIAVSAGVSANKHNLLIYDGSGTQLANVKLGITAQKIALSADQKSILVGTNRAELIRFDLSGNELGRIKLNYDIVSLKVLPEPGEIVVAMKDSSFAVLDDNLKVLRTGKAVGGGSIPIECMSMGASADGSFVGLGSKEGFFSVLDSKGSLIYSKKVEYSVTGVLFTGQQVYVTGLGDFLYQLDEGKLHSIVLLTSMKTLLLVLSILLPVLCVVAVILAVQTLRRKVGHALYVLHKHRAAYLLLVPTMVLLLVFCYYPAVIALIRAFTNWSRAQSSIADIQFIGLQNFRTMIDEGYFYAGLKNLLIIILTSFIKVLTVPLLVAKLVFAMRSYRAKYWFRFLFVVPMVVPGVVGALMWAQIYDPTIGLINQILQAIGMDEWKRVWLGDANTAIWAVVFMGFPFIDAFAFLVYYGGLINIPSSLFEAAKVDGSNPFWDFARIQIPLLRPQFKLLVVLTFIGAIQNFTSILLLTAGGPGSATYVPGLELYYNATKFGRYGYACALGVVMFVAILAGTILNMRMRSGEAAE